MSLALFRKCSLYGLFVILTALRDEHKPMNVSQLARETKLGSREQVRKYLRLTIGLKVVSVLMGAIKYERQGPWVQLYKITPRGKTLLDLLEHYDEHDIVETRTVFRIKFAEEP